ncbi:MAG: hypothetical protein ACPG06_09290, partial [Alphaproteobacteria bacterium]
MKHLSALIGAVFGVSLISSALAQDSQFEGELLTAPGPAAVEQQPLSSTSPTLAGVLPQAEGGLGLDLWQNTTAAQISGLLGGINIEQLSPASQSTLSRLLLSESHPPADATQEFLSIRLSLLARMGELPGVAALSERALTAANPPGLAEGMVSAHLMDGGLNAACETISKLSAEEKQGTHWARLEAVCHEREGRSMQAELSLEIGADTSEPDPLFDALYLALGGHNTRPILPTGAAQQHPFSAALHLALIREIGLDPSIAGASPDDKISLRTIIRSKGAPLDQRILAAEKAITLGQIFADELANLYALTQSGLNVDGQSGVEVSADLQAAAIQHQKVKAAQPGRDKATAIATALASAQNRGQFTAAAYLYADDIRGLTSGAANKVDTAIIARALLNIGAFLEAKPWFMVTYQSARDRVPGSFEQLGTVWPLIAMAGEGTAPRGIQRLAGGWLTSLDVREDEA